jgi:opacity protein-like surface antigen
MENDNMNTLLKTSASAAVLALFVMSPAAATDLGGKGSDPTSSDYVAPISWTGFYVGGQVGYGIATADFTSVSTTQESSCHFDGAVNFVDVENPSPSDDRLHDIGAYAGLFVTNVTEQECAQLTGNFASGAGPIGTNGGYSYSSLYVPEGTQTTTTHQFNDSGVEGGVVLGYDQVLFNRFLVGVFGEYNWSAIDGKDSDWAAGGRVGFIIAPRVMAYGLLGYAQADYGDVTFEGIRYGGGIEAALTENVFIGAQYTHTDYDTETLINTPSLKVDADLDEDRVMATLKVKLNGGFGF